MSFEDSDLEMECYFGEKALNDAMLTGENQIFLSASRLRSDAFRDRVTDLALPLGVTLSGDFTVLPNGAQLIFLTMNSRVMSAYSGNVYAVNCFDEINFADVSDFISGWTMLKKHRAVFFAID